MAEEGPESLLAGRIEALVTDAIRSDSSEPYFDLDFFHRLLYQRAIPCRTADRRQLMSELGVVREELKVQKARDDDGDQEAHGRQQALQRREKQILDQLWPRGEWQ